MNPRVDQRTGAPGGLKNPGIVPLLASAHSREPAGAPIVSSKARAQLL